jgi:hypothetical protein
VDKKVLNRPNVSKPFVQIHAPGSRKAIVYYTYSRYGEIAAYVRGRKLGLAENTLITWIYYWKRRAKYT